MVVFGIMNDSVLHVNCDYEFKGNYCVREANGLCRMPMGYHQFDVGPTLFDKTLIVSLMIVTGRNNMHNNTI